MYLTDHQTQLLGELIATLAEGLDEHEIRQRMGEQMLRLFDAQFFASYIWDPGNVRFGRRVSINMEPKNLVEYERYYQFHDPITPLMQTYRTAVRATDVLSHESLKRTEFYNDFLARDGLYWGVNLYAWDGDRNIGDMRIWRDRRRENFTREELELLDLVRPAFVTALRRCRGDHAATPAAAHMVEPVSSLLSDRQREVVQLVSCGLSDKEIAQRLGISLPTVRTHIGHAFRKHGVDNRVRLVQALQQQ